MLSNVRIAAILVALSGPALANPAGAVAPEVSLRPVARAELVIPKARWDHRREGKTWSRAALMALSSHASTLPKRVPRDIAEWCPAYPTATEGQRKQFWVGLVSALAKHESTYRPDAVGGGGKWYGLLQILPATARGYGCKASSADALKDGSANLSCGLRIMSRTVARDGVISAGMRGVAADWGPFHSSTKLQDMKAWVRQQDYCTGLGRSLRPVARPAGFNGVFSTRSHTPR